MAGCADALIVPNIEAGTMLARQLACLTNARSAGIAMGERVPIILTSRAAAVPVVRHGRRKAGEMMRALLMLMTGPNSDGRRPPGRSKDGQQAKWRSGSAHGGGRLYELSRLVIHEGGEVSREIGPVEPP
nr:hypothetical protein [Humitalea rosea]